MEVFADCFPDSFRNQLYPAVEEMQEVLGNANDSCVASRRLTELSTRLQAVLPQQWKRLRAGLEGFLHYHQARLPQERQRFQEWWSRWQQSGGEVAFHELLKTSSDDSQEFESLPISKVG
jgi:CHAD domain-containing protein